MADQEIQASEKKELAPEKGELTHEGLYFTPAVDIYETEKECVKDTLFYLDAYKKLAEELLAVPVLAGKKTEKETEKPAKAEEQLLKDIAAKRASSTTERYQRLGLNAYQGNKAKDSLIQKDLIEVKDLPTPTGRIKLLKLTAKGRELAGRLGVNPQLSCRKGGSEHEYWKEKIARDFMSKGYQVIEEYPLGKGKAVDLLAAKDEQRIAIEIETGKSDAIYNIRKNLEAGFDRVLSLVPNRKLKDKIDNQLKILRVDRNRALVVMMGEPGIGFGDFHKICESNPSKR